MKSKRVDVLFISSDKGELKPIKFKIDENDDVVTVNLRNQVFVEESRFSRNRIRIYSWEAVSNGYARPCKPGYEIDTCTWLLMSLG